MKLERCPNGHYYDTDKYLYCPYCAGSGKKVQAGPEFPEKYTALGNIRFLAEGSTGAVWSITPPGSARPRYALKVIAHGGDAEKRAQAAREAEIMQMLKGVPHVIGLEDWTEESESTFLLEKYEEPLSRKWQRSEMRYRDILTLAGDICRALEACLEHGIMHLDVQPKNVFCTGDGRYLLGDFGSAETTDRIRDGVLAHRPMHGTMSYVAPEVFARRQYSERSEIYALGITLYALLNGLRLPFAGECGQQEAVSRRLSGERFAAPDCPVPGLSGLVMLCCAYNPNVRVQTFAELEQALKQIREACPEDVLDDCCIRPSDSAAAAFDTLLEEDTASLFVADAYASSDILTSCPAQSYVPDEDDPVRAERPAPSAGPSVRADRPAPSCASPVREERRAASDSSSFGAARRVSPGGEAYRNVSEAEFSAVAPRKMTKGDTSVIDLVMYEPEYRKIVDQIIREAEEETQEKRGGVFAVGTGSHIRVELTSPDLTLEDCCEEGIWRGKYLSFSFAVYLPEEYKKRKILLTAVVYVDGVPLTRLRFTVNCFSLWEQKLKVVKENILTGFVSYASADRDRVASRLQGMLKVRPEMDLFFDIESLRSGEDWEDRLRAEIDRRDILFLFWSKAASESEWVDREWRYALSRKGPGCIEPVPIDPPSVCPPPEELSSKHFNDKYLFMTNDNGR